MGSVRLSKLAKPDSRGKRIVRDSGQGLKTDQLCGSRI